MRGGALRISFRRVLIITVALTIIIIVFPATKYNASNSQNCACFSLFNAYEDVKPKPCTQPTISNNILNIVDHEDPLVSANKMKSVIDNVVIVTACMGRNSLLNRSLASWLNTNPTVGRIIIVDWSSETPLEKTIPPELATDDRVEIVRVRNQPKWILSWAYNIASRVAAEQKEEFTDTWMLKADCDTFLHDDFFTLHPQKDNTAYVGRYNLARNENEMHLNGIIYLKLKDFQAINGYDERIQSYGWDDDNLYARLQDSLGLDLIPLNTDALLHLSHGNKERTENQASIDHGEAVETQINRLLSSQNTLWNQSFDVIDYETVDKDNEPPDFTEDYIPTETDVKTRVLKVTSTIPSFRESVPTREYANTERKALIFVLRKLGMPANLVSFSIGYMDKLVSSYTKANGKRMLIVHLQKGLANRILTLSSAIVLAEKSKRHLRVLWIPDDECQAKFKDLFKNTFDVWDGFNESELKLPNIEIYDNIDNKQVNGAGLGADNSGSGLNDNTGSDGVGGDMTSLSKGKKKRQPDLDTLNHVYIKTSTAIEHELVKNNEIADIIRKVLIRNDVSTSLIEKVKKSFEEEESIEGGVKNFSGPTLPSKGYVGVHIKTGKDGNDKQSTSVYITEMERLLATDPQLQFFLSTDNTETLQQVLNEFSDGKRIKFVDSDGCYTKHADCLVYGLADLMLLGSSKGGILGSAKSPFTQVAGIKAGIKPQIAGISFPRSLELELMAIDL